MQDFVSGSFDFQNSIIYGSVQAGVYIRSTQGNELFLNLGRWFQEKQTDSILDFSLMLESCIRQKAYQETGSRMRLKNLLMESAGYGPISAALAKEYFSFTRLGDEQRFPALEELIGFVDTLTEKEAANLIPEDIFKYSAREAALYDFVSPEHMAKLYFIWLCQKNNTNSIEDMPDFGTYYHPTFSLFSEIDDYVERMENARECDARAYENAKIVLIATQNQ